MGICYIFGATGCGRLPSINEDDYVIAADAGYLNLGGIAPDIVVGDFDSLGFEPEGVKTVRHPARKDDTDMMLAVRFGLEKGYDTFMIYGGLGERLDHTIANIHLLKYLIDRKAMGCLVGAQENAVLIKNSAVSFNTRNTGTVSVFAYGGTARGVTLEGLAYPLREATLTCDYPLGVSNEFTEKPAKVSVLDGYLLVIWAGEIGGLDWPVK